MVNQIIIKRRVKMTRLLKSIFSALLMFSLVSVLPAETTTTNTGETIVASADVKKKKKKGKKLGKKGKKKKKGFFSKAFGSK
jgi:hypothetical protein|tara:strand:+ start:473 stop:718 length:246 start_codon:yes stop_codon:yes gene_type:complete